MAGGNSLKALYEVSFAGSRVVIGGANISEFMDDSNPIDIQDTETTNIEWSCNGRMIRTIKPAAIILSITVIPGSASDNSLRKIWKKSFCNGGSVNIAQANQTLKCTVSAGNSRVGSFTFTGGTPISGAAAFTANGQGKMGGNTYTFAFENVEQ